MSDGPYVFRCMSTYVDGAKQMECRLNPLVQEALGVSFASTQAPATNVPAGETVTFTETVPVSELGGV